jgi:mono/diheme cytochrome c family protein
MVRSALVMTLAVAVATTACAGSDSPGRAGEAESVTVAAPALDAATFDTVAWTSGEAALTRGAEVYVWACADCHGAKGAGDAAFVRDGETLQPPSFLVSDWRYADDSYGLRGKVFEGGETGMPHWGVRRMQPRDIVAVDLYIRETLRNGR